VLETHRSATDTDRAVGNRKRRLTEVSIHLKRKIKPGTWSFYLNRVNCLTAAPASMLRRSQDQRGNGSSEYRLCN